MRESEDLKARLEKAIDNVPIEWTASGLFADAHTTIERLEAEVERLRAAPRETPREVELAHRLDMAERDKDGLFARAEAAEAEVARLREVLVSVEFVDPPSERACPSCYHGEDDGHAEDCCIAAALAPAKEPGTAHGRHIPPHTSESVAEPAPEPKCATCINGIVRTLGMDNDEIIDDCPDCSGGER